MALGREELALHYQPVYRMDTGALVAVEALLRWHHPTRGLLQPGDFLDAAEGRTLMIPIGDWVLATAVDQADRWRREFGDQAPDMWVNISGDQLGRQHLHGVVEKLLAKTGLPPGKLGLEVTERQLIRRADAVAADLRALRELGVSLAVDDFGTGYASLGLPASVHLRRDQDRHDHSSLDWAATGPTPRSLPRSLRSVAPWS